MVKTKDMHYLIPTIKLDYIKMNILPLSLRGVSYMGYIATSNN